MKTIKTILMLLGCSALILVSGCAAGISRTGYKLPENQSAKSLERCPIAIRLNANCDSNEIIVLGSIREYDTGFSTYCDEAYVLDMFCKEGCMLGADLINIKEEKEPSLWSTCYRAKAQFLRFKDRAKVTGLLSDAKYAPNLIIERSIKSNKRTTELIVASVLAGPLGAIVVWSVTGPHDK